MISIQEGLGGNTDDYDAIDNGFLHRVLDTRRGWPITVSILWMEVGRRAGIEVQGVALPGHFLVFAGGQLVDPFHFGEAIGQRRGRAAGRRVDRGAARLEPTWLNPVDTTTIVQRVLNNLATRYEKLGDERNLEWVRACASFLAQT